MQALSAIAIVCLLAATLLGSVLVCAIVAFLVIRLIVLIVMLISYCSMRRRMERMRANLAQEAISASRTNGKTYRSTWGQW